LAGREEADCPCWWPAVVFEEREERSFLRIGNIILLKRKYKGRLSLYGENTSLHLKTKDLIFK
jgi:hypothetical protein